MEETLEIVGNPWPDRLYGTSADDRIFGLEGNDSLDGGDGAEDAGVADKAPDTATQMQAFEAYRGRLLFIYGGNDPETPPSREFYREFVQRTGMDAAFHEVEGANHNYYSLGWKEEVIGVTLNWLGLAAAGGGPADEEPR